MKYAIYKFNFLTGIHIGDGRLSGSSAMFQADTLFSALCQEAQKMGGVSELRKLVRWAEEGKLLLSDSMPYIGETLFLPKPMIQIKSETQDSSIKKQVKKLAYISAEHYGEFLQGKLDIEEELKTLEKLGKIEVRTKLNKRADTGPYQVGVFHYKPEAGPYVVVAYAEDEILDFIEELLYDLGYDGIGGKISSGLGKFEPVFEELPDNLLKTLEEFQKYPYRITLSISLPKEQELSRALTEANYGVVLRSGFVASSAYADTFQRRKDLYCLKAGACIRNCYLGDVYDVSAGGRHPVYRYAKPMFMGVRI